jgi:3-phenylpropionate/cinnamic acid dioxygenase small subunit
MEGRMSSRTAIEETLYRYAVGFDEDDLDMLANCFTEDAEVSSGAGENRGRPMIRDAYQARRDARRQAGERVRHLVTNVRVEFLASDRARVHSYYALVSTSAAGTSVRSHGTYEDDFVHTGGEWLIARRRARADAA